MIELTDEMKECINSALADGTPCILATASADGTPNLGPKGSMMVLDDQHLAYWERTQRIILAHIEENPKVAVLYRNPTKRINWRFHGVATVHKEGPIREQVMARVVEPELSRDPERRGFAVVIKVNRVTNLAGQVLQERE